MLCVSALFVDNAKYEYTVPLDNVMCEYTVPLDNAIM